MLKREHRIKPTAVGKSTAMAVYFLLFVSLYTVIADVEQVLSDVIFINKGEISLCDTVDNIRINEGKSVDEYFREVFRC